LLALLAVRKPKGHSPIAMALLSAEEFGIRMSCYKGQCIYD
jgi:hypothetical protein